MLSVQDAFAALDNLCAPGNAGVLGSHDRTEENRVGSRASFREGLRQEGMDVARKLGHITNNPY